MRKKPRIGNRTKFRKEYRKKVSKEYERRREEYRQLGYINFDNRFLKELMNLMK